MKQKNNSSNLVTKDFLKKELGALGFRFDIKMDRLRTEIDDKAKGYRDEVLTKIDGVMGELQTMKEENIIGSHQITRLNDQVDNHEKRISKIEQAQQAV